MTNIFAEEENLNTTVYEKEGFDSLDDYFKKILELKRNGNDEEVSSSLSKLNSEEKEAFVDWAHADSEFTELVKIMIRGSLNKVSFNISENIVNEISNCLMSSGLTVVKDAAEDYQDNYIPYAVKFTDNNLIEGSVEYGIRKVHLSAVDAYGRLYDKTIDYLGYDDLIDSIFHFQKDIAETYENYTNEELSKDWSDILGDKEFMSSLDKDISVVEER